MSVGVSERLVRLARQFNCFYLRTEAALLAIPVAVIRGPQAITNTNNTNSNSNGTGQYCRPFIVEGHQVGLIRQDILDHLTSFPEVFFIKGSCVELNPAFRDYRERTDRVADVLQQLRKENKLCTLRGWRNECYAVSAPGFPDLLEMDRSATCLFGIRNHGVTINGYVKHPTKGLCIWFQQRSNTKETWPGKWDNMVSGGLSVGFGILETAIKEAAEEASISENMTSSLVPVGCVSFFFESERGLFPNTEYVYDIELPIDFVPDNSDGEVQRFELLTIEESIEMLLSPDFKTTSAPVVIDFLIRKGFITPDNEPNFVELIELIHVPLQTIFRIPFGKQENGKADC